MARFWIAVASREHVMRGVQGGFAQVCHGKCAPLKRMAAGDWIMYYSPTDIFGDTKPYRRFTALGKVANSEPYIFEMSKDFIPWRRKINYTTFQEAAIEPLLAMLSFIPDKKRWGFPFRRGIFEIQKSDFLIILQAMGAKIDE